jgi:hypothetical protein
MTPPRAADSPPGSEGNGRERRAHPRATADWPLSIRMTSGAHAGVQTARVRDLSRAGVCFYLENPLPLMTLLEIVLELPGETNGGKRRVRGTGAVVRCEPISAAVAHYEVAVFIQEMEDGDRDALAAHVTRRAAV